MRELTYLKKLERILYFWKGDNIFILELFLHEIIKELFKRIIGTYDKNSLL
jgi:hypothetical protein